MSENGKHRIITNLVGLSDKSFKKYCEKIGADDESYYKEGVTTGRVCYKNSTFLQI